MSQKKDVQADVVPLNGKLSPTDVVHNIEIRLTREGNVYVNGPLHDKILCYGLLTAAQEIISKFDEPSAPPKG